MNRKKKLCWTANGDLKEKSREGAGAVVDAYLTPPVRDIDWLGNRQTKKKSPFDATKKKKNLFLAVVHIFNSSTWESGHMGRPVYWCPAMFLVLRVRASLKDFRVPGTSDIP